MMKEHRMMTAQCACHDWISIVHGGNFLEHGHNVRMKSEWTKINLFVEFQVEIMDWESCEAAHVSWRPIL